MRALTLLTLLFSAVALVKASGGNKVLVLLDNLALKESHSTFFKTLNDLGLDLSFKVKEIFMISVLV